MKIIRILILVFMLCTLGVYAAEKHSGTVYVKTVGNGEIVVTLGESDHFVLAEGDSLRRAHRYEDAIASYEHILTQENIAVDIRHEAEYDIGLCILESGDYTGATARFNDMLTDFTSNGNALAHVQYCLAWIEVQEGKYDKAIGRLEQSLDMEGFTDRELRARTLFMVGRIYANFKEDYERAKPVFERIRNEYPGTKTVEHPYLKIN